MTYHKLEIGLMIAQEIINEAEEAFSKPRQVYQELRKYTDQLESILKEHNI